MRIVLVHPSTPAYGGREGAHTFYPPIGLACIASPLRRAGHEVRILDVGIQGLAIDGVVNQIRDFAADIVGIRCMFITYPRGLAIAEAVRKALPSCKVVLGGPHMGLVAEEAINEHWYVDAVVQGEGEYALLEYVGVLERQTECKDILGLVWRSTEGAVRNPPRPSDQRNMEAFPAPAFELLPMHLYKMMNFFALEGHRGCPNHCVFCSLPTMQTRIVRYKPPEHLVAEIERLVYEFGINRFEMVETNFTIKKSWVHQVCTLILERSLPIQWIARTYPELVDRPTLKLMREAGCYRLYYGIESGSKKMLKNYEKVTTIEQAKEALRASKEVGIDVYCDFLVGGPGETSETVEETIQFVKETDPHYAEVSLITPFPGTAMYDKAEQLGVKLIEPKWYEKPDLVSQYPFARVMELDQTPIKQLEKLWLYAMTQVHSRAKT